jgi:hypothetical protein
MGLLCFVSGVVMVFVFSAVTAGRGGSSFLGSLWAGTKLALRWLVAFVP